MVWDTNPSVLVTTSLTLKCPQVFILFKCSQGMPKEQKHRRTSYKMVVSLFWNVQYLIIVPQWRPWETCHFLHPSVCKFFSMKVTFFPIWFPPLPPRHTQEFDIRLIDSNTCSCWRTWIDKAYSLWETIICVHISPNYCCNIPPLPPFCNIYCDTRRLDSLFIDTATGRT